MFFWYFFLIEKLLSMLGVQTLLKSNKIKIVLNQLPSVCDGSEASASDSQ